MGDQRQGDQPADVGNDGDGNDGEEEYGPLPVRYLLQRGVDGTHCQKRYEGAQAAADLPDDDGVITDMQNNPVPADRVPGCLQESGRHSGHQQLQGRRNHFDDETRRWHQKDEKPGWEEDSSDSLLSGEEPCGADEYRDEREGLDHHRAEDGANCVTGEPEQSNAHGADIKALGAPALQEIPVAPQEPEKHHQDQRPMAVVGILPAIAEQLVKGGNK